MPKTRPDTVAGFSVSTPTPCRQICRLLPHLHAHFHANHLFLYHKLYQVIFSRSIFDRLEFLSHRTHALDYRSIILIGSSLRSRRFFSLFVFVIVAVIILLLSFLLLPFPAIYFLFSLVYSLPLTPHFHRHLRNFTHYHWNDNGRGRKRISLVGGWSRLPDSLRRQTVHGTFPDRSFLSVAYAFGWSCRRSHTGAKEHPPSRYDFRDDVTIPLW